jgi:ubiquinone/menaquinone biosynthesis C-methylase UbiE
VDRLAATAELLDGPLDDPDALDGNLRDLRRVNRWLFGARLSVRAVDALIDGSPERDADHSPVRILDVGTGAADIPVALLVGARRKGRRVEVLAVDSRSEVLDSARRVDPRLRRLRGLTLACSDGRALPYEEGSFDVAHSSLVVHHLEPDEAVTMLRELARVARRGVVLNDLLRSQRALAGARLLAALGTRNRLTRHDGPLSARRAYTAGELDALLTKAGLRPVTQFRDPFRHRTAIAARLAPR